MRKFIACGWNYDGLIKNGWNDCSFLSMVKLDFGLLNGVEIIILVCCMCLQIIDFVSL